MRTNSVRYYSTNHNSPEESFRGALLKGLAPDGGLYLPATIPSVSNCELDSFADMNYPEIAFTILSKLIGDEIGHEELNKLCHEAYNFSVPLEHVVDKRYIMRLDQGPTASFKDFAARMMSRLMQHYLSENNQYLTILTATSGDTGSAVASAFYGLKNINVIILFPRDEVSSMQRKQMTTLKDNIRIIAVNGKFDDCQSLVKKAFRDPELSHLQLSSANSINIGRLLPQSVYYFYAWSKLSENVDDKAVFSVPSGNFGNLMGGLIARKMGLPVSRFIVATNENDEVPEFIETGHYRSISPSKNCISSAMNVGHPSNLARIITLFGGIMDETGIITEAPDMDKMREVFYAVSVTDDETREEIASCYNQYKLLLEPHGAVAWRGTNEYFRKYNNNRDLSISLETAHPAKFPEELQRVININPPLPASLAGIEDKPEHYDSLENNYDEFKDFIKKNY